MNVDVSQPAFNVLAGPPNPEVGHVRPAPYRVGATHAQDAAAQAEGGAPANAGAAPVSDSSPAPAVRPAERCSRGISSRCTRPPRRWCTFRYQWTGSGWIFARWPHERCSRWPWAFWPCSCSRSRLRPHRSQPPTSPRPSGCLPARVRRALSRHVRYLGETCSHPAHHRFPAIVRDRHIHRSASSRTSSLPRWFPR
jgi:hypothetical protein